MRGITELFAKIEHYIDRSFYFGTWERNRKFTRPRRPDAVPRSKLPVPRFKPTVPPKDDFLGYRLSSCGRVTVNPEVTTAYCNVACLTLLITSKYGVKEN
jgi:hypothetical protein